MPRPAHCPGPAFFLLLRHPRRITPALHVRNRPKHPRHSIRCRSRPHRPARAVRSDRSAAGALSSTANLCVARSNRAGRVARSLTQPGEDRMEA